MRYSAGTGLPLADAPGGLKSVQHGHFHIHDNHRRIGAGLDQLENSLSVDRVRDTAAGVLQHGAGEQRIDRIVFRQDYFHRPVRPMFSQDITQVLNGRSQHALVSGCQSAGPETGGGKV